MAAGTVARDGQWTVYRADGDDFGAERVCEEVYGAVPGALAHAYVCSPDMAISAGIGQS
jgi:hypothetical protein